ncbi:alternate F1F0 ATPase, F1 subunit alpha [Fodinibius sediminis]|uniref:ATP synthase subunit alpha n=1 Tax=Fodinibius sediminis TaxID=1214077 RepID=A0A521CUE7_9BACT|nr:alternate F1F0 ATPase, F1 subunit alpha [Fodinibius sediminis]SMO63058.1 F-type H+-transporting ATPase subunit alpha [Fodinibius sediminis]
MIDDHSTIPVIGAAFDNINRAWTADPDIFIRETGKVISVGEGIARVEGLPNVVTDELVKFANGSLGLAYNLDPDEVGVILLGEENLIEAGDEVFRTERVLGVPVGDALLGRVVDALGRPLDEKGTLRAVSYYPVERPAPPIMNRVSVSVPLQTGIVTIDALLPIGRGQRELILGDRQTGKTAIAVDSIVNQKDTDVICIYCAIGKQRAEINRLVSDLQKQEAMEHTIVMSASSSIPVGLQYTAPYAATSMGEYFMEQGRDVLIIYDDLTWHARAYRELALLLRRPPGREAYPGDIFYIHARLLERCTRLREEYGGGSMTALPIIETQAQDMSAFIPTNLISITDGQIYLSPTLFRKDVLPAIDVGKSVSRVGGAAQLPAYRMVTDELRLDYAQFEELEAFSRFSSRLDEDTRRQIERGKRIREILKQDQFDTMPVIQQVALLVAVTQGVFDDMELPEVKKAARKIRMNIAARLDEVADKITRGEPLNSIDRRNMEESVKTLLEDLSQNSEQEEGV